MMGLDVISEGACEVVNVGDDETTCCFICNFGMKEVFGVAPVIA